MRKFFSAIAFLIYAILPSCTIKDAIEWPQTNIDMRPGTRWWWLGSAVDSTNIEVLMREYADAGIGTVEITPIYGVQGNDANEIPFLSDRWLNMLKFCESVGQNVGIHVDMNTGTGWPFGGPQISEQEAARKLIVTKYSIDSCLTFIDTIAPTDPKQRRSAELLKLMAFSDNGNCIDLTDSVQTNGALLWASPQGRWTLYAVHCGHTFQKVKRAAPGGEGLVVDHFAKSSVEKYLARFDEAFAKSDADSPHNFFNDSYEVYGADCTPNIFIEFEKRRGYKLENYLPQFLSVEKNDTTRRIVSDYCETLSELLLENFTETWTDWAHKKNSCTRNQAHGSPANLIDVYAAVDIPECEGFGLSDFGIRGLRKDSLTRRNDSDFSMLKYASSAAHITGKKLTSSETFTWLTEHFRTSFSQCKPDLDLMFVSGVNHVYLHGTTYSPADAKWPGWKFYASVDMSPTNPLWRDMKAFCQYIERAQSFLQMGAPDNDFLVYLPIYDIWYEQCERLLQLSIHDMARRAPQFINAINTITSAGYDVDYISDNFLKSTHTLTGGNIETEGGTKYKAIVIPDVRYMPIDVLQHISKLVNDGATAIFVGQYPTSVPGFGRFATDQNQLFELIAQFQNHNFELTQVANFGKGKIITGGDFVSCMNATFSLPEAMKSELHLQYIRRSNEYGHHYFVSNLTPNDVDEWVKLSVKAESAMFFDAMSGARGLASLRQESDGAAYIRLQLKSGESLIIRTFNSRTIDYVPWHYRNNFGTHQNIDSGWTLSFVQSEPQIDEIFNIDTLCSWTEIDDPRCKTNMGTSVYTTKFQITDTAAQYWIDLGDVRETARLFINNHEVATLIAVPYQCDITNFLVVGENEISVEVTGLPANRIAEIDRQNVPWRRFKEINIVDIKYRKTTYEQWPTTPCGLLGPVCITKN